MPSAIEILVSDSRGVYVPQSFVSNYDISLWSDIDPDDVEILAEGPEHEYYWETWNDVLSSAKYIHGGNEWVLHQDGDLFAICYELMTDQEYEDFFGEARETA